jgi:hypothetical protein
MSKIFIPHYTPRFDYSAATQFGELQPITDRAYSFNSESAGQIMLLADMVRAASVYDEFEDYLLLGGVPLNTAHFIQLLTNRGISTIRSLVWNSNDGAYTVGMYRAPTVGASNV